MKVISWNILHGMSIPPLEDDHSEVALARLELAAKRLDVEVLGLQEIDHLQERSFHIHHVLEVAHAMGAPYWAFAPTLIGTPGGKWQAVKDADCKIISHQNGQIKESAYGIGLISKIPVKQWHRIELGRSKIGLPLTVPSQRGLGFAYVKDEPRIALVAELENGFTVAVTHLSFVPIVNFLQLKKLQRSLKNLSGIPIIIGDLNLPWNLPQKSGWRSLGEKLTYPSWSPKIQFDYILAESHTDSIISYTEIEIGEMGLSDHLPIGVEIKLKK